MGAGFLTKKRGINMKRGEARMNPVLGLALEVLIETHGYQDFEDLFVCTYVYAL